MLRLFTTSRVESSHSWHSLSMSFERWTMGGSGTFVLSNRKPHLRGMQCWGVHLELTHQADKWWQVGLSHGERYWQNLKGQRELLISAQHGELEHQIGSEKACLMLCYMECIKDEVGVLNHPVFTHTHLLALLSHRAIGAIVAEDELDRLSREIHDAEKKNMCKAGFIPLQMGTLPLLLLALFEPDVSCSTWDDNDRTPDLPGINTNDVWCGGGASALVAVLQNEQHEQYTLICRGEHLQMATPWAQCSDGESMMWFSPSKVLQCPLLVDREWQGTCALVQPVTALVLDSVESEVGPTHADVHSSGRRWRWQLVLAFVTALMAVRWMRGGWHGCRWLIV